MNLAAAHLALRAHALAVVVATTGSMALEATASGYARASGSFVTDGFLAGMEVVPTGFTQTTPGIITAVSALTLTIQGGRTAQASGSGRTLAVGVPSIRVFENLEPVEDGVNIRQLVAGRPYFTEEFAPATQQLTTNRPHGVLESTGLYVCTWAGLANYDSIAIRTCADALLSAFPPGEAFSLADGSIARVRGDVAPWARQITNRPGGWAACICTIPWKVTARLSS